LRSFFLDRITGFFKPRKSTKNTKKNQAQIAQKAEDRRQRQREYPISNKEFRMSKVVYGDKEGQSHSLKFKNGGDFGEGQAEKGVNHLIH